MSKTLYALLLLLPALALADESAVKLRQGSNQDVVARNCAVCHSLDYIQMNSRFLDRKGWEVTVTKMVKVMGAPIKEEDVPLILDYLDQQYGKPK